MPCMNIELYVSRIVLTKYYNVVRWCMLQRRPLSCTKFGRFCCLPLNLICTCVIYLEHPQCNRQFPFVTSICLEVPQNLLQ